MYCNIFSGTTVSTDTVKPHACLGWFEMSSQALVFVFVFHHVASWW